MFFQDALSCRKRIFLSAFNQREGHAMPLRFHPFLRRKFRELRLYQSKVAFEVAAFRCLEGDLERARLADVAENLLDDGPFRCGEPGELATNDLAWQTGERQRPTAVSRFLFC